MRRSIPHQVFGQFPATLGMQFDRLPAVKAGAYAEQRAAKYRRDISMRRQSNPVQGWIWPLWIGWRHVVRVRRLHFGAQFAEYGEQGVEVLRAQQTDAVTVDFHHGLPGRRILA